ncbi:unnamed protein product [Arabidopsis lyrata]|nr:unnamed protein product [Arabidopsis lyrata]
MASLTLPFFSSIPSLENTTDKKSFCKFEWVVKKLYLPEHSNVIKYGHWKHLANCSLEILFPGPDDLAFKKNESVEKGIEEGSFYEFIHDDEKIGKIILMEKHFAYTLDDKEIETMKYYDVIEKKKQTLKDEAEEKMKQKLKEEKTRNENESRFLESRGAVRFDRSFFHGLFMDEDIETDKDEARGSSVEIRILFGPRGQVLLRLGKHRLASVRMG